MLWRQFESLCLVNALILVSCSVARGADYVFAPASNAPRLDLPENWIPYGGPAGPEDRIVIAGRDRKTVQRTTTVAQIPDGFELIWITDNLERDDARPSINDCGEIVYGPFNDPYREIFYYENGKHVQVTNDPTTPSSFPGINNNGTIVWKFGFDENSNGVIKLLEDDLISDVGLGSSPVLNDAGQIAYTELYGVGCFDVNSDIFLFDGETIVRATENFLSNQGPRLNSLGHVVWTHYNFCKNPWPSMPGLFEGSGTILLPSAQFKALAPDIRDDGVVAWGGPDGIEIYQDDAASFLTDWGRIPRLNEQGDISFIRWHDENDTWQVWLYSNQQFFQLTDDAFWSAASEINDYGEVVIESGDFPQRLLRYLRRIRNGDIDFNGQVNAIDYAIMSNCLTGPIETDRLCECRFLDMDHDRDVDLSDYARFSEGFDKQ